MQRRSRTLAPTPLFVLVLVALAGACNRSSAADPEEDASASGVRRREIPPVRATRVERREMVQVQETTAWLESEGEIQVFPRSMGVAVEVLAEEGDVVEAGAVLARMDDRDEALAVSDAEVALEEAKSNAKLLDLAVEDAKDRMASAAIAARQAERDHERDRQLADSTDVASPLSEQAVEASLLARENARHAEKQAEIAWQRAKLEARAAENAIRRAQVGLERARLAHSYKEIVAPFDGVVAERAIRVGATINTAEPAFVLSETENLRAVFPRPQEELGLYSLAGDQNGSGRLTIRATADAFPGEEFTGWVERVSPTIEPESGQFRITARLQSPDEERVKLLPGMHVRMRIVTDRHPDALVVPKRALRREGDRRYVLVIDPATEADDTRAVRRVVVEESFSDDDYVEIVPTEAGALEEGQEVVLVGSRDLVDGDPVAVDELSAPTPLLRSEAAGMDAAVTTPDAEPEPPADDGQEGE